VIAIGCFILWFLVASQMANAMPTSPIIVCGALVSFAIGIWIRVADL
jgi:hypothetical protein